MASNTQGSIRAIIYAFCANGGIAVSKFAAALYTGSGAMLAESIHSLADCVNQVFLLVGIKEARRAPDRSHPMGYARVVYFWAMLVALLLFFMGGAFSVMEGIEHLQHPEPLENVSVALAVLGISVVLEAFSLYGAMREIRKISGGEPFFKWFRHTRQSELMVVAGEDIAALLGLVIAFLAVLTSWLTGDRTWDALGSIAVGVLLMVIALFITREVKAMIVGESADPKVHAAIAEYLDSHPEIDCVINLITMQWGDQMMLAIQAKMREQPSARALIEVINHVESELQERWPQIKWCFFEPDLVCRIDN